MLDMAGKPPAPLKPEIDLRSINQPSRLTELLAGFLVLAMVVMTLSVFFMARAKTDELTRLDETYATLSNEIQAGKLANITKKAEQVAQALAMLKTGTKDSLVWSGLFQTLQGVSTNGVTLVSLSVDSKNLMKLEGTSETYVLLAHYLATLHTAAVLKRVDLLSASLVETLNGQKVNFVVQIEIDPAKVEKNIVKTEGNG
ncbi:MAG: PilN domain-containing protein [Patescibacteria group bacterium]